MKDEVRLLANVSAFVLTLLMKNVIKLEQEKGAWACYQFVVPNLMTIRSLLTQKDVLQDVLKFHTIISCQNQMVQGLWAKFRQSEKISSNSCFSVRFRTESI